MKVFWIKLIGLLGILLVSFSTTAGQLIKKDNMVSGEIFNLKSSVLGEEREVFVSLPESYNRTNHQYPVIYVLDAEFLFDITRSSVAVRAARNYMPESIIIGIPNNTGRRMDMALEISNDEGVPFFYGEKIGQTDKYLRFFREELFPNIENNFRVNNHRTIIGLSPTFGPVLEAFWSKPDLFSGYIVLAAEIGQRLKSGKTIAEKLIEEISDKKRSKASIYIGTSSRDIKKRGDKEGALYTDIPNRLKNKANPLIRFKFEIIPNEDHYGMAIPGIQRGLDTIFPREIWVVDYKKFWRSADPAKSLSEFYNRLSNLYGFKVIPVEKAFFSIHNIAKTAEIMERQKKKKELVSWLELAVEYYPYSSNLHFKLSRAYAQSGQQQLADNFSIKAKKLIKGGSL